MDAPALRGEFRRASAIRVAGPWRLVAFGLILALALLASLAFPFLPSRYALNEGDVSPYDVKSPGKITYVSQSRTSQERQRAAAAIADVYRPIPDAAARAQAAATSALTQIGQVRSGADPEATKIDQLTRLGGVAIGPSLAAEVMALDDLQWRDVVTATLRLVDRTMRGAITAQQLGDVRAALPSQVDPALSDRAASVAVALARQFVGPTEAVDAVATGEARKAAGDLVQPVRVTMEKGETIFRNGDVVTAEAVEKLEAAGLRNPVLRWPEFLSLALVSVALSTMLGAYVHVFQRALAASPRRLLLLGILLLAPVIAAKLTIPGRPLYAYLFPVAAAPMLLTILLGAETSLVATAMQAIVLGMVASGELELVVAVVVAGGLGALSVHRLERVNSLTRAALIVAAGDLAVVLAFELSNGELDLERIALLAFLALVSGGLSAALTLGTVSFLGNTFGIATTMNLLELAHPSQPLFRRLLTEAPGTYHHSVVVANLAERATAAIGGDTLLARIGGYYHDIGKLTRPYAFIENQLGGENVHEQLDPFTSARVIVAHVTDGLHLAARHGIPARVRDLIAQHHGTMLVQYFYRQACQRAGEPVDESAFQYPGPRPRTREAAILMLADGVEATVRACRDHSPENIAQVVERIFQERIASGQLDESDLTLTDIQEVRAAFSSVLQGIFHPRIEYPIDVLPEPQPVGELR